MRSAIVEMSQGAINQLGQIIYKTVLLREKGKNSGEKDT
jgi:hypothetical protein